MFDSNGEKYFRPFLSNENKDLETSFLNLIKIAESFKPRGS